MRITVGLLAAAALALAAPLAAGAGTLWVNPYPQGDDLMALAGGPDGYVAAGAGSRILTGTPGDWQVEAHGPPTVYHDVVAPVPAFVVAAGEYGRVSWLAGGQWQTAQLGTGWLYGAAALATGQAWVTGAGGAIHHFDGAGWSAQASGTGAILLDVDAAAADAVWACSSAGAAFRYNGSAWSRVSTGSTRFLRAVSVLDNTHVWIAGDQGTVLFGGSGGFVSQSTGTSVSLYDILALAEDDVWAVGSGPTVLHDDGTGWQPVAFPYPELPRALAPAAGGVLVAGERGLLAAHAAGRGWSRLDSNLVGGRALTGLARLDDGQVLAVGAAGAALGHDGDGWTVVTVPGDPDLAAISTAPGGPTFAAGAGGALLEWQAGAWQVRESDTRFALAGLHVLDGAHAWAAGGGSDGTCSYYVVSTYGGASWSALEVGES